MAQYDGSIRINTKIDSKDAKVQLSALQHTIVKTADEIASLRSKMDALKDVKVPTKEFTDLEAELRKAISEYDKLQAKMQEPGKPTEKYKALQKDLQKAQSELEKLAEQQDEMEEMGLPLSPASIKQLADASDRVDAIKEKMNALEEAGKAFVPKVDTKELDDAKKKVEDLKQKLDDLKASGKDTVLGIDTDEYASLSRQLGNEQKALAKMTAQYAALGGLTAIAKAQNAFGKLGEVAKSAFSKITKFAKRSGDSVSSFGSRIKGLAMSALIFNQISKAFNSMFSGMKEGFGNLYNEIGGFKNSVDGLKASMLTLKNSFAAAFRPLVEIAVPYIQKAVDALASLMNMIGQFTAAITGQKTYTKAIKQTTAAIEDENKAQNKQLSSLDKLNNLTSSSGTGDADTSLETMFEEVPVNQQLSAVFQKIAEYAQKLKDIFSQGFWDGLGDWEYRWESIKASIASIKDSLIDIWTDPAVLSAADGYNKSMVYMLGSLAGSAASIGLTLATNLIGGVSKYLEQNSGRIKEFVVSMFDIGAEINYLIAEFRESLAYVFEAFASEDAQQLTANVIGIFTDAFMGVTELAGELAEDVLTIFIQPFVDNKEEFRTALEGFLSVLSEVTGTIKEGIDETFDKLNEVYDEHFKPFFDSIASGLSDTVGKFMEFWNGSVQPILDEWAESFDILWKEHIQPAIDKFIELFGKAADFLKAVWENVLKPFIDWIIENVLPVVLPIIDGIVKALGVAFGAIADVVGGIIDIIGGILDFLTGVFTGDWEKAWDGIVSIFDGVWGAIKGIVNGILGVVESLANGVINGINFVIGALNGLSFDLPDWLPGDLGGKTLGFNIPELSNVSIPRLATGTVVPPNNEFLAVLGDNKREPEVVSPLSTIEQAVENAMRRNGGMGGGEITIKIPVEIDGNVLFELIKKLDLEQYNRTKRPSFQM